MRLLQRYSRASNSFRLLYIDEDDDKDSTKLRAAPADQGGSKREARSPTHVPASIASNQMLQLYELYVHLVDLFFFCTALLIEIYNLN